MLTAQRLDLEVALLPLLSRRVELVELGMVGPVITLESDATGQKNWEFRAAGATPASTPGAPAPAPATPAMLFGVGDVEIANGSLVYRDSASGGVTQVAIDKLSLRNRNPAAPIDLVFRGKVNDIALAVSGTLGTARRAAAEALALPGRRQGRDRRSQGRVRDEAARRRQQVFIRRPAHCAGHQCADRLVCRSDRGSPAKARLRLVWPRAGPERAACARRRGRIVNALSDPDQGTALDLPRCSRQLRTAARVRCGRRAVARPPDAA